MRVELIYHPQCYIYKSVHKLLEDVIADEQLPIPVEMVEDKVHIDEPFIRVDGHTVMKIKNDHSFDHLRDFVRKEWSDINHPKKHNNKI